jgi:nucleoid-associated protein YgaU
MRAKTVQLSLATAMLVATSAPTVLASDDAARSPSSPKSQSEASRGDAPSAVGATAGQEYVVREGDTLAGIADTMLGSPEKWKVIARANGIDHPSALRVGQKLMIPAEEGREMRQGGEAPRWRRARLAR